MSGAAPPAAAAPAGGAPAGGAAVAAAGAAAAVPAAAPVPPPAVPAAEGAAALTAFINCIASPLRLVADLANTAGVADAGESLNIRITGFVSDFIAGSINLITLAGSSGATAAERNAFWIDQLRNPETVAVLKGAKLDFGELTNLDHLGRALQRALGARNTDLAGQLAAAAAATAAASAAATASASALALATAGGGVAGTAGARVAAGPTYTMQSLSGQQTVEAHLARVRLNARFLAGMNYADAGQYALARVQLGPQNPPTQESNLVLRLMSGLSEQTKVENKLCTADRQHFQDKVLVYDQLVVVKLTGVLSANSRRSRRWRVFTGAECATILVLIKALDPKALLSKLHLFSSQEPVARRTVRKGDTSLNVLNLPELEDAMEGLCIALSAYWGDRVEPADNGSAAIHLWKWISDLADYNDKCRIYDGTENGFHALFLEIPWRIFQDWTTGLHAEIDTTGAPATSSSLSWLATETNAQNLNAARFYRINEIKTAVDSWYLLPRTSLHSSPSLPVLRRRSPYPPPRLETEESLPLPPPVLRRRCGFLLLPVLRRRSSSPVLRRATPSSPRPGDGLDSLASRAVTPREPSAGSSPPPLSPYALPAASGEASALGSALEASAATVLDATASRSCSAPYGTTSLRFLAAATPPATPATGPRPAPAPAPSRRRRRRRKPRMRRRRKRKRRPLLPRRRPTPPRRSQTGATISSATTSRTTSATAATTASSRTASPPASARSTASAAALPAPLRPTVAAAAAGAAAVATGAAAEAADAAAARAATGAATATAATGAAAAPANRAAAAAKARAAPCGSPTSRSRRRPTSARPSPRGTTGSTKLVSKTFVRHFEGLLLLRALRQVQQERRRHQGQGREGLVPSLPRRLPRERPSPKRSLHQALRPPSLHQGQPLDWHRPPGLD